MEKHCTNCNQILDVNLFFKDKSRKGGFSQFCKVCDKKRNKEYRKRNKEKVDVTYSLYKKKNLEKLRSYQASYRESHKEERKEYDLKYAPSYYKTENGRAAQRRSRNKNISYKRVIGCLRSRINSAFKEAGYRKSQKAFDLLGCSIEEARVHLESQFKPGMTWENRGKDGWHIDHIKPCAAFDLTDPEQQKLCFHYTNLQPLWASENISKSSHFEGKKHYHNKENKQLKRK